MNEQWNDLFSMFGWSRGGFDPGAAEFFRDLEQMMQQRTQEMALEGQAAEGFAAAQLERSFRTLGYYKAIHI